MVNLQQFFFSCGTRGNSLSSGTTLVDILKSILLQTYVLCDSCRQYQYRELRSKRSWFVVTQIHTANTLSKYTRYHRTWKELVASWVDLAGDLKVSKCGIEKWGWWWQRRHYTGSELSWNSDIQTQAHWMKGSYINAWFASREESSSHPRKKIERSK